MNHELTIYVSVFFAGFIVGTIVMLVAGWIVFRDDHG